MDSWPHTWISAVHTKLLFRDRHYLSWLIKRSLHLLAACISDYLFAGLEFHTTRISYLWWNSCGILVVIDLYYAHIHWGLIYWKSYISFKTSTPPWHAYHRSYGFFGLPGLYRLIWYYRSLRISLIPRIYSCFLGHITKTYANPSCHQHDSCHYYDREADAYYFPRWILVFHAPRDGCLSLVLHEVDLYYVRMLNVCPSLPSHVTYPFPPEEVDHVSFTYIRMLHNADLFFFSFWSLLYGSSESGIRILILIQSSIPSIPWARLGFVPLS